MDGVSKRQGGRIRGPASPAKRTNHSGRTPDSQGTEVSPKERPSDVKLSLSVSGPWVPPILSLHSAFQVNLTPLNLTGTATQGLLKRPCWVYHPAAAVLKALICFFFFKEEYIFTHTGPTNYVAGLTSRKLRACKPHTLPPSLHR